MFLFNSSTNQPNCGMLTSVSKKNQNYLITALKNKLYLERFYRRYLFGLDKETSKLSIDS